MISPGFLCVFVVEERFLACGSRRRLSRTAPGRPFHVDVSSGNSGYPEIESLIKSLRRIYLESLKAKRNS